MQTIKKILHTNKLMEKVCRFSGFQKLMLFWIPLILTGSFSYLMLQVFVFFPQSFTKISSFFLAWQMFVCWVWLFISFQVHSSGSFDSRNYFIRGEKPWFQRIL